MLGFARDDSTIESGVTFEVKSKCAFLFLFLHMRAAHSCLLDCQVRLLDERFAAEWVVRLPNCNPRRRRILGSREHLQCSRLGPQRLLHAAGEASTSSK